MLALFSKEKETTKVGETSEYLVAQPKLEFWVSFVLKPFAHPK